MLGIISVVGLLALSASSSLAMDTRRMIAEDMMKRDKDPYRFGRNSHILHTVIDKSDSSESNCSEEE